MSFVVCNGISRNPGRRLGVAVFAGLAAFAAAAEDVMLGVQPAEVPVTGPGVFQLAFPVERAGADSDGVRLLVETAEGGANPAVPGQDYTPLPVGTQVLLAPGQGGTTVNVEVFGDHIVPGMDKTLLLQLSEAYAYNPQARLNPAASHFSNCCFARDMVMADVNGDGHLDIVTGNDQSWDVSVLLGDGSGGFGTSRKFQVGNVELGRVKVAAGDVTGNGHVDLLSAGFRPQDIVIFEGDGSGEFAGPQIVSAGAGLFPSDVTVADVNGNGHNDIVTSNGDNNNVSVLLSDGQGGFMAAVTFPTGDYPNAVTVADATGNGHADILTANGQSGNLSVLEGDGSGQFSSPQHYSAGDNEPSEIIVADVTGNGHADIVTANQPAWGRGLGGGPSGSASVLEGDGVGGFAAASEYFLDDDTGRAQSVAVADVTGNGHADIVVSQPTNNTVSVFSGDGAGGFVGPMVVAAGNGPNPLAIADVTGNGYADVIVVNSVGENISVLPGDGAGNLGYPGNHGAGEYPHSVAVADFNGDGHLDVATANIQSNDVSILINDGQGGFAPDARHAVDDAPSWIVAGDVNGNGTVDLVTANLSGGTVSVLYGDGVGGFAEPVNLSVGAGFQSPYAVALGDVNGNGFADIATANTNIQNHGASLLLSDGQGGFEPAVMLDLGDGFFTPQAVTLADATGNGYLDVVMTTFSTVALFEGNGTGNFADVVHLTADEGPVIVIVADVTGNGHPDLVTLNHTAQSVSVLAGEGDGNYAPAQHYPIFVPDGDPCTINPNGCPWPWGMTVADVTGDGHLDIVTANTDSDTVTVMVNDGAGDFSSLFHFDTGAHPGAVAVGDVTGDGNADVVTANRQSNTVSVLSSALSRVVLLDDEALGTIIADTAAPAPVQFESTLLPQLDPGDGGGFLWPETRPLAINNARVITGHTGSRHGFVWSPEEGGRLLQAEFPEHADTAVGVAVNESGHIAGDFIAPGGGFIPERPFIFTSDGEFTPLPPYDPDLYARAADMNDAGIVVGSAETEPGGTFGGPATSVYWVDGELHDIGGFGSFLSRAFAINNHNVIVGYANTPELQHPTPYRWTEADGMEPLPQLVEGLDSTPHDINDQGIIVGLGVSSYGSASAVYWDAEGEVHALPSLNSQATFTEARAVNNQGYIVGRELPSEGDLFEARLWIDGAVYRLQDLVTDLPDGYWISEAMDINDNGDIIALGLFPGENEYTAVLLTLVIEDDELFSDRFEVQQ